MAHGLEEAAGPWEEEQGGAVQGPESEGLGAARSSSRTAMSWRARAATHGAVQQVFKVAQTRRKAQGSGEVVAVKGRWYGQRRMQCWH